MESHGLPGAIQVTQRAYEHLRERYELRPRGTIEVKGKGPMTTYLLLGQRDEHGGPASRDLHDRAAQSHAITTTDHQTPASQKTDNLDHGNR